MEKVLGIDPGINRLACVVADGDGWYETSLFSAGPVVKGVRERVNRWSELAGYVMQVVDLHKPSITLIEGYSLGSKGSALSDLIEVGFLIRCDLCSTATRVIAVAPSTLKKFVTGHGAGDKTLMIARITKRWGVEFSCTDIYDAFALAQMALTIQGGRKAVNQKEREAIGKVLEGQTR